MSYHTLQHETVEIDTDEEAAIVAVPVSIRGSNPTHSQSASNIDDI